MVCRSGDPFYVGRKFVPSRRRVAAFEALLERLTERGRCPSLRGASSRRRAGAR